MSLYYENYGKHSQYKSMQKKIDLKKKYDNILDLVKSEGIEYVLLRWIWPGKKIVIEDIPTMGDTITVTGIMDQYDGEYSYFGKTDKEFEYWCENYDISNNYVDCGEFSF